MSRPRYTQRVHNGLCRASHILGSLALDIRGEGRTAEANELEAAMVWIDGIIADRQRKINAREEAQRSAR